MNIEAVQKEINTIGNELRDLEYRLIRNSNEMGKYLADGRPTDYVKKKMLMAIYSAIAAQIGVLSKKLLGLIKEHEDV